MLSAPDRDSSACRTVRATDIFLNDIKYEIYGVQMSAHGRRVAFSDYSLTYINYLVFAGRFCLSLKYTHHVRDFANGHLVAPCEMQNCYGRKWPIAYSYE